MLEKSAGTVGADCTAGRRFRSTTVVWNQFTYEKGMYELIKPVFVCVQLLRCPPNLPIVLRRCWLGARKLNLTYVSVNAYGTATPRAGSGVVRMDPLRFLAGCRTRRLSQV